MKQLINDVPVSTTRHDQDHAAADVLQRRVTKKDCERVMVTAKRVSDVQETLCDVMSVGNDGQVNLF